MRFVSAEACSYIYPLFVLLECLFFAQISNIQAIEIKMIVSIVWSVLTTPVCPRRPCSCSSVPQIQVPLDGNHSCIQRQSKLSLIRSFALWEDQPTANDITSLCSTCSTNWEPLIGLRDAVTVIMWAWCSRATGQRSPCEQ